MNLDLYVKNMKKASSSDAYTAVLASLPPICMLKKLLNRKQNGKKKFSDAYQFNEKIKRLLLVEASFAQQLEEQKIDVDGDKEKMKQLSQISFSASEEIANASLKEDYLWIGRTFQHCADLLNSSR